MKSSSLYTKSETVTQGGMDGAQTEMESQLRGSAHEDIQV